ncbi:MAG TPA: Gfo/Idh/MocA family oxidoreductase [Candidatus Omnitrophota bacterium]|nr:Gfo/Idh/MocA family oxidoreductase [Candidatus Omnitrophota bacterium]HPD84950.1 Gfo/Idh/MocA family oxidoreductase [Candidatus Omnitrophota bacterium]HRZ03808.1 Gfo/Idh/MocA family oxidoreductase [Candidatus Omnitrophota bacterium]
MDKVNVAVIGIGHLGSRHLKVYSELTDKVNIAGICDINLERTGHFIHHYKVSLLNDYRHLLGKVDAVSICVPTVNHFSVAKEFLEHGAHVLVEKPITTTLKEADQLIAIAKRKKLKLQVGHVERFNSAFQAIQDTAKNPLFIECHRLNLFPNRSLDIGVVMDLMIHDIDIVLGLVNSKIRDISAVGVKVLTNLEDIANVRLVFKNGCVCNLTASRVSDDVMRKIRIFLNDTYISLDYVKQEAFVYKKNGLAISKNALPIEKEEPLKKELESFIDCIREDKKPIVSGVEGRQALEIALQISKKIWKNPANI